MHIVILYDDLEENVTLKVLRQVLSPERGDYRLERGGREKGRQCAAARYSTSTAHDTHLLHFINCKLRPRILCTYIYVMWKNRLPWNGISCRQEPRLHI
jgi:hypothetical protein